MLSDDGTREFYEIKEQYELSTALKAAAVVAGVALIIATQGSAAPMVASAL